MTDLILSFLLSTTLRSVILASSAGVSVFSFLLGMRAWRRTGLHSVGFISVLFGGWALSATYFAWWYFVGDISSSWHLFVIPNLASSFMNIGALGFLWSLFHEKRRVLA